jgi:hypothetical protein
MVTALALWIKCVYMYSIHWHSRRWERQIVATINVLICYPSIYSLFLAQALLNETGQNTTPKKNLLSEGGAHQAL